VRFRVASRNREILKLKSVCWVGFCHVEISDNLDQLAMLRGIRDTQYH
jgi:hypothetical protein